MLLNGDKLPGEQLRASASVCRPPVASHPALLLELCVLTLLVHSEQGIVLTLRPSSR